MRSEPDKSGRPHIKAAHFYSSRLNVNGKIHDIGIVVRELHDGRKYYDHFELKPKNASPVGSSDNTPSGVSNGSDSQPTTGDDTSLPPPPAESKPTTPIPAEPSATIDTSQTAKWRKSWGEAKRTAEELGLPTKDGKRNLKLPEMVAAIEAKLTQQQADSTKATSRAGQIERVLSEGGKVVDGELRLPQPPEVQQLRQAERVIATRKRLTNAYNEVPPHGKDRPEDYAKLRAELEARLRDEPNPPDASLIAEVLDSFDAAIANGQLGGQDGEAAAPAPNLDMVSRAKAAGVKGIRVGMSDEALAKNVKAHLTGERASRHLAAGKKSGLPQYEGIKDEDVRAFAGLIDANPYALDASPKWILNARGMAGIDKLVAGGLLEEGNNQYKHALTGVGKEIARQLVSNPIGDTSTETMIAELESASASGDTRPALKFSRTGGNSADTDTERQFKDTERAYGGRAAYDRAKDAGKTRLTYGQWVQVRTPSFKAWFGDWEGARELTLQQQVSTKVNAEDAMAKLAMQNLRNLETGIDAQINNKQRGKLVSNAAVAKSMANGFTREEHYALAANIAALWRHASLVGVFNDEKNGDPNVRVRRFAVPVRFGAEVRYASIVAKETLDEQQHRVYTLEVHGEKTLRGMLNALSVVANKSSTPTQSVDLIVAALNAKVNQEAVSKAIDPDTGEPLVVYHGTNADFAEFKKEHQRPGQYGGQGFFFTANPDTAGLFGDAVMPVFLQAKTGILEKRQARTRGEDLQVDHIRPKDDARDIWVVMDSSQIKSATGNDGAFDPANPDIRRSFAAQQAPRTPITTVRAALTAAYGKLAAQLEERGLVTLTQTQEQAIEAAARARAQQTGGDVGQIKRSLMASVHKSLSPMKSVDANIRRGLESLTKALNERTTVHRAMFRNGLGWVDFVWGDVGKVKPSGKTKGAMGLSHIFEARQRKDGLTDSEVRQLLEGIVSAIASGAETRRNEVSYSTTINVEKDGIEAILTRTKGSNTWLVSGWNRINPAESGAGSVAPTSTVPTPTTAQHQKVSGFVDILRSGELDVKLSADGNVQGFFDPQTGQAFMVADNLSAETAPGVLLHEVGIHMAADASMKPLFNRSKALLKLQKGDPFMQRVQAKMDAAGETSGEEAAAYLVEEYERDRVNAPATVKKLLSDLLAAVKAWLHKKGILGADNLTVADIAAMARANAKGMAAASVSDTSFSRPAPASATDMFSTASGISSFLSAMNAPVEGVSEQVKQSAIQSVSATVQAIRATWGNAPEVEVAFDMTDPIIPQAARDADLRQRSRGATGDPEGFYFRGKVYLLASRLNTDADAARVLLHESLGHYGLHGVFGQSLSLELNKIATMRPRELAAKAVAYGLYDKQQLGGLDPKQVSPAQILEAMTPKQRLEAAEEVLAEVAQTQPTLGFVRRAVAAIRTWLREHFPMLNTLALTDDEIINSYILPAQGWVQRQKANAGVDSGVKLSRSDDADTDTERQFKETERAYGGRAAYGRAKDAGKTSLAYGQWVQVRTPSFKAWFGDWEAVRAQQQLQSMSAVPVQTLPEELADGPLREDAKRIYNEAAEKGPITTVDGREVQLTAVGFKKTRFHSADRRVLDLLGSIREVLGKAVPVSSLIHEQENPSDSVRAWHYYGAKVKMNGRELFAKLVVRESVNGQIYYDNDLSSVEEISGRAGDATQNKPRAAAVSADKHTLAELLVAGNHSTASKAIDPDTGEPLVVYRGDQSLDWETGSEITSFNSKNGPWAGFFTDNPDVAGKFVWGSGMMVYPVYIRAPNPLVIDAQGANASEFQIDASVIGKTDHPVRRTFLEGGYDALVIKNTADEGTIYIPKNPAQIKSATGNNGAFDPANPDIRFSRATPAATPPAQPAATTSWNARPEPSGLDKWIRILQDKHVDTKRVQASIEQAVGKLQDEINAYQAEELHSGRATKRTQDFLAYELEPMLKQLAQDGIELADFEEYLHARHAPEANRIMAERNPNQAMIDQGIADAKAAIEKVEAQLDAATEAPERKILTRKLNAAMADLKRWRSVQPFKGPEEQRLMLSGMSDEQAQQVVASLSPVTKAQMDSAAKRFDAIVAKNRELMVDYELESQDAVDSWANLFEHYVPLMRDQEGNVPRGLGIGQGFSIKGREVKGRTGSTRKVVDIVANLAMQRERTIIRGERNLVAQSVRSCQVSKLLYLYSVFRIGAQNASHPTTSRSGKPPRSTGAGDRAHQNFLCPRSHP